MRPASTKDYSPSVGWPLPIPRGSRATRRVLGGSASGWSALDSAQQNDVQLKRAASGPGRTGFRDNAEQYSRADSEHDSGRRRPESWANSGTRCLQFELQNRQLSLGRLRALARNVQGQSTISRYLRPISARSNTVTRRVPQDHARSFCTMKAGSARGSCETWPPYLGSPPDVASELSQIRQFRTKMKKRGPIHRIQSASSTGRAE